MPETSAAPLSPRAPTHAPSPTLPPSGSRSIHRTRPQHVGRVSSIKLASHPLETSTYEGEARPVYPLRPGLQRASDSRRSSLPGTQQPPGLQRRPQAVRLPSQVSSHTHGALSPLTSPPLFERTVSTTYSQAPLIEPRSPEAGRPSSTALGSPAPVLVQRVLQELERRATFGDSLLILTPPILGLAAKITLAIGVRGVMLAEATHTESGAESAEWFGVIAIGVFALIGSIAIGSYDAAKTHRLAPVFLGAASVLSATAFALGEYAVIRSALDKKPPAFLGGSVLVWFGMFAAAITNASYLFYGETARGAIPIPRRNLTVMSVGMASLCTMFVFSLNASSQHYSLALRDSVLSVAWLAAAIPMMLAFSEGIRSEMGLSAHKVMSHTPTLPPPVTHSAALSTAEPRQSSYFQTMGVAS